MATLICPECNAVVHTKSKRFVTCMRCKHKAPVYTYDNVEADPAFDEAINLLNDAGLSEHQGDERGPCLCSQCKWARKVITFLTKHT